MDDMIHDVPILWRNRLLGYCTGWILFGTRGAQGCSTFL